MIEAIVTGTLMGLFLGAVAGFFLGLGVAVMSRDGIWPEFWATIIIAFAVSGGVIGILVGVLT